MAGIPRAVVRKDVANILRFEDPAATRWPAIRASLRKPAINYIDAELKEQVWRKIEDELDGAHPFD